MPSGAGSHAKALRLAGVRCAGRTKASSAREREQDGEETREVGAGGNNGKGREMRGGGGRR